MFRACIVAAVAAFLAVSAPASRGAAGPAARVKAVVDGVVIPLMQRDAIPGMAVGLVVDGRPYVFRYGVASRATRAPVTDATLFELGSVSKTFTATLAARAQETGRLSLADPVGKFLPALHGTPFGDVSLLELATHTPGGLPVQVPDGVRNESGLFGYLKAWRPKCAVGTCRTYSNIGIGVLGLVCAASEDGNFAALVQRQVLVPLGMHNTWYAVPADRVQDYAEGYTAAGAPVRMTPGVLAAEAYGLRASAPDMVRYLMANLGLLDLDTKLRRAIAATHTGYFKAAPLTQDLAWEQYRYPVALQTLLQGNSEEMIYGAVPAARLAPPLAPRADAWINKTGSTNGFSTYVAFIPERRLGIVLLANRSYPTADRVTAAYRILAQLAGGR